MRRSTRKAAKRAKQRISDQYDYMEAPDYLVLSGKLPSPNEASLSNRKFDRIKDRADASLRIPLALKRGKRVTSLSALQTGPIGRHVLFMNVGDENILEAVRALNRGGPMPPWTNNVSGLSATRNRLFLFENSLKRPFALKQEKRHAVKTHFFDPKKPSTIQPITDALRHLYCNISRRNVSGILKSLETYQLMRPLRTPPKIQHHTVYTKPGVIAMDTFFPSENTGWGKINVLCCMDIYSRFSRAYALEKKQEKYFEKAMNTFFSEIMSLGVLPRRLLTDKGSELHIGTKLMEKFRQPKDGTQDLHLRSVSGTPVLVVEGMNAQYQRRLEPYRISDLHNDVSPLLWDISEQLNNQRRPKRGNHTPYELLQMTKSQRSEINKIYDQKYTGIGVEAQKSLPILKKGDHVRKLMLTFKEQAVRKKKGFQEKWSRQVYEILGKVALNRNKHVYRFRIGDPKRTYYRHELLLIPKDVDQGVLRFPTSGSFLVQDLYKPRK